MKKFFLTILLSGVIINTFSQDIEKDILTTIYKDIQKQNEYYKIKNKLKGVSLIFDPISGITNIVYSRKIENKVKIEFEKYSKEEQLKILNLSYRIINLKDTLFIVDTTCFFSEGQIINQNKSVIKVSHTNDCKKNLNQIFIFAVGIRNNNLIVSLSSSNQNEKLYNYYFDLKSLDIKLNKTLVIDNKKAME